MSVFIGLVPAIVLWALTLARVRTLKKGRTERALWCTLVTSAIAGTLQIPAIGAWLADLTGLVNPLQVIKHGVVIGAAAAAREVIRGLVLDDGTAADGTARRIGLAAGAAGGLVVTFLASPITAQHLGGLTGGAAAEPSPMKYAYWLIYLGFLGSTLVSIARMCRWFRHNAPDGSLRSGLTLIGHGSLVGLAYVANKAALLIASALLDVPDAVVAASTRLGSILIAVSFICLVVGIARPALRHLPLLRQVRALIALHRLEPLWSALEEVAPHIAWTRSSSTSESPWQRLKDAEARLYDRVVEIHDGLLALRAEGEDRSPERRVDASAAELAARIAASLSAGPEGDQPLSDVDLPVDATLHDLTEYLERVARALPRDLTARAEMTGTR